MQVLLYDRLYIWNTGMLRRLSMISYLIEGNV